MWPPMMGGHQDFAFFPADSPQEDTLVPEPQQTSLMITVHSDHLRREALSCVDIVIAVGKDPDKTIQSFCSMLGIGEPALRPVTLEHGEVLVWFRYGSAAPFVVATEPGKTEHRRHVCKYAEGNLGPGSFVFRGPDGRLNLVAHNLNTFIRMAEGVDDETWLFHLKAGHISDWFHE